MRKKEGDKRRDILKAATKIFAKNGYYYSKVINIAEKANVATGSVYIYFKDKQDILLQLFEDMWKKIYYEFENISIDPNLDAPEKLTSMIEFFFDLFSSDKDLARVYVNEQTHLLNSQPRNFTKYYYKFLELGEKIVVEGKSAGTIRKEIDVAILKHFILGSARNLLHQWATDPNRYPLEKIKQNLILLINSGISPTK